MLSITSTSVLRHKTVRISQRLAVVVALIVATAVVASTRTTPCRGLPDPASGRFSYSVRAPSRTLYDDSRTVCKCYRTAFEKSVRLGGGERRRHARRSPDSVDRPEWLDR